MIDQARKEVVSCCLILLLRKRLAALPLASLYVQNGDGAASTLLSKVFIERYVNETKGR